MLRASELAPHDAGFGLVSRHETLLRQVEAAFTNKSRVPGWCSSSVGGCWELDVIQADPVPRAFI